MMTTTAYSYIRFSTPSQMGGDSLRRQLKKSEKFAAAHGLKLDTSHRDLGLSAFKGVHRVKGALASFLEKVEKGEIERGSYLIVENLDRLSREHVLEAVTLFLQIIQAGIVVATLSDDMVYSRESMTGRPNDLTVSIAAFIKANKESRDKSDRVQEAWDEKRANLITNPHRKLTRQGPAWLDLIADDPRDPLTGEWRENAKADVVREIYRMSINGLGKEMIARRLNDAQTPTFKHGDGWQPSTVHFLLSDRRALGEYQPHSKIGGTRRAKGQPIIGYFPAVVSEEVFYRAQTELRARYSGANPAKKGKVPNIFVGIARCECGRSMEYRNKNTRKQGWSDKSVYLVCSSLVRHAGGCHNLQRFTYSKLEESVLDWVTDIVVTDEQADLANEAALKLGVKQAVRNDLNTRLRLTMDDRDRETDTYFRDDLMSRARAIRATLESVEAEIVSLDETIRTSQRSAIDDRRSAVRNIRADLAGLEGDELFAARAKLASALRQVIDHIQFDMDGGFFVTMRGGRKAYQFTRAGLGGVHEMPEDRSPWRFPTSEDKGSKPFNAGPGRFEGPVWIDPELDEILRDEFAQKADSNHSSTPKD